MIDTDKLRNLTQILQDCEFSAEDTSKIVEDYKFRITSKCLMEGISELPPELIEIIFGYFIWTSVNNRLICRATNKPLKYYIKSKGKRMPLTVHKSLLCELVTDMFAREVKYNTFGSFHCSYWWRLHLINTMGIPATLIESIDISKCKCVNDISKLGKFCERLVEAYKNDEEIRTTVENYFSWLGLNRVPPTVSRKYRVMC